MMERPMPRTRLLGEPSAEAMDALRRTLLRCYSDLNFYADVFGGLGITRDDILNGDPIDVLQRLPILEGDSLHELSSESLQKGSQIVDMETSSGTTGPRKTRYISHTDDVSETRFLAELFSVCGIGASDRIACLDTDPLTLMVSFTKALDLLGVEEAYAFCVGVDFDDTLKALPLLNPTVIISVPSILERCFDSLRKHFPKDLSRLSKRFVYVGEPMPDALRAGLESEFGAEVFGYYGASETSALGIECRAHDGIHLFTDRNIIEMKEDEHSGATGEIIVTTLNQETLPLLRYALSDVIAVKEGECACGLNHPRVEVKGRVGDSFSVLGAKLSYNPILNAVYEIGNGPRHMQLVVTRDEREKLDIVLPRQLESRQIKIRESLVRSQPDLDFLMGSKYLEVRLSFVDNSYFMASRKRQKVVDLRGAANDN